MQRAVSLLERRRARLEDVWRQAAALLRETGLAADGWSFEFDGARSRLGSCRYRAKRITLSRNVAANATQDEARQILLHEVAHALVPRVDERGRAVGHGPAWRAVAASLGYTGSRTAHNPYLERREETRMGSVSGHRPRRQGRRRAGTAPDRPQAQAGDVVVLTAGGPTLTGQPARVLAVGPKRYKVILADGEVCFVPFSLTRTLSEAEQEEAERLLAAR